jgi:hypothetical protein
MELALTNSDQAILDYATGIGACVVLIFAAVLVAKPSLMGASTIEGMRKARVAWAVGGCVALIEVVVFLCKLLRV